MRNYIMIYLICQAMLLLPTRSEAADHYKFSPFTGKPDNTGPFLAGTLTDGKTCTYTSATGTIDCNTSGGGASAAGGLGAVQYNSPVGTLAGDETKVSINPSGNVGIGTTNGLALFSVNSSAAQDLFRVDDSAGSDSTPFIIDQTGNVGIGSANPSAVLAISSTLNQALFRVDDNGTGDLSPFIVDASGNVGIGTTNTEQDRLLVMGGNVGIGTWVPSTKLDVAGSIVVNSGGNIGVGTNLGNFGLSVMVGNVGIGTWVPGSSLDVNGSIKLPSNGTPTSNVFTLGSAGTGIFSPQANWLGFSIVSTQKMTIDNNGNVGIGTTNPSNSALTVVYASGTQNALRISNTATNGRVWLYGDAPAVPPGVFSITDNSTGLSRLSIVGSSGNVGIGTINSVQKLSVVGNIGIGTVMDGDNFISTLPPNGGMIVEGNVGIGSNSPGQKLDVSGAIRSRGTNQHYFGDDNKADIEASATTTPDLIFKNNSTETMRLTNGNNVGIGTSLPDGILSVGLQKVTVLSGGNVGIGSIVPSQVLDVNGAIRSAASGSSFFNGIVGIGTTVPVANLAIVGNIGIGTVLNGDKYLTLAPPNGGMVIEGNVGLGTFAPAAKLHVGGTTGLGWSVKAAANQACNTTCNTGAACVFGEDTSVLGSFVDCSDATADRCVCAGP